MDATKKTRVLQAFELYLNILKIFNVENFKQSNGEKTLKNIGFACGMTGCLSLIPFLSVLLIWHLVGTSEVLRHFCLIAPLIISILQMGIKYIALASKNRVINETIERLQNVIDQRK